MPQRLSAQDAQYLHLETPSVHMHVAGLMIFDPSTRPHGPLRFDNLRALIERRIHLVPRFRQRVVEVPFNLARPMWVDEPDFDLDFHLRRSALPAPGGRRELADAVQRIMSRPLDRSKPLWELYFFEGLEDGHVAAMSKVHHCMIDGISGMDIATILLDFTPEPRAVDPQAWVPEALPSARDLMVDAVRETVTRPVRTGVEVAATALRAPVIALERASHLIEGLGSLVAAGQAPRSPLNAHVGPNRRFAMAEAPLQDFKEIKNALGGTVNDVVLASAAGMLHRLLTRRGIATEGSVLRAMVPVSTRDPSKEMALGNQVSNIFVDLPVGPMDPAARLHAITERTRDLKKSKQAIGAEAMINLGTWAPPTLHGLAARLASRSRLINLVVSNVPGPQVPLYMDGARLVLTFPLMPLAETCGLSIAVTSLSGVMGFGLTADWDTIPEIDAVADALLASIEELVKAARA